MLNLSGSITIVRRLIDSWMWEREPLCAGACWVDLLCLARTEPGTITINGHSVALQRGDVGFAIHSLAARWRRSREWTTKFLGQLADTRQIELVPVEPGAPRRGTIIRIINYETYNTNSADNKTDNSLDNSADNKTDNSLDNSADNKTDIKGEGGRGKGKKEVTPQQCGELPSESEIQQFCEQFKDAARGISGIPEVWWRGWLSSRLNSRNFPARWQESLKQAFLSDWAARHPKALAGLSKKNAAPVSRPAAQKNAADESRSPKQRRFELSRELESVQARLDAAYDLNEPADPADRKREKEIKAELKALE